MWWVDHACAETKYGDIAAGGVRDQSTYTTHPWRLRDTATRELLKEIQPATTAGATTVTYS